MNEIRCPGCEKSFAVELDSCPHCGAASLWKSPRRPSPFPTLHTPGQGMLAPAPSMENAAREEAYAPVATQYARDWGLVRAGVVVLTAAVIVAIAADLLTAALVILPLDSDLAGI